MRTKRITRGLINQRDYAALFYHKLIIFAYAICKLEMHLFRRLNLVNLRDGFIRLSHTEQARSPEARDQSYPRYQFPLRFNNGLYHSFCGIPFQEDAST